MKKLSKIIPFPGYSIIIICFFFPFILIKCSDGKESSIKGFDFVKGGDISYIFDDLLDLENSNKTITMFEPSNNENIESSVNPDSARSIKRINTSNTKNVSLDKSNLAIISFMIPVLALILNLFKIPNKSLINLVISFFGMIVLISFGFKLREPDNIIDMISGGGFSGDIRNFKNLIIIQLTPAFYVAVFAYLFIFATIGFSGDIKKVKYSK